MTSYVVELTGWNGAAETTVRFAMGPGIAFTDAPYAEGGLLKWESYSQKIEVGKEGGVTLTGDQGKVVILNAPPDSDSAGPWDAYRNWAWTGRRVSLYSVEATWASRTLLAFGLLEQPVSAIESKTITFPVRDPRAVLRPQLQPTKYAGTNVAGAGVEGEADLKGTPKPILYGTVSNIPGIQVNRQKLIYQLADKAATVLCARDGGLSITTGTVRASLASLEATIPAAGTYDTYAGAEGTFVRLGSTPFRQLTFDAQEGANDAARTHAQIWSRIRTERCGNVSGDLNAASIAALDVLDADPVGFWWSDDITRLDAINEVLASCSGYEVLDFADDWRVGKLVAASGTPVINIVVVNPTVQMKAADRALLDNFSMTRPAYMPDGAPPYRVNVHWGRNYTVMSAADFNGAASTRLKEKFATQWRTETAKDDAIWNPVASTGLWPTAPELNIYTGYQPGADGVTCPHAATEAAARLALYSSLVPQFAASITPEPTDQILPGDVVSLKHPQMGLSAGVSFRVLQPKWLLEGGKTRLDLVLGLGV